MTSLFRSSKRFWIDYRSDVVLIIEVWQASILLLYLSLIVFRHAFRQMIEIHMCKGNPRGCRHCSRSPTSSHDMVLREVGQDQAQLIFCDVRHAAPHLHLNFSSFRCFYYEVIPSCDVATSFPQETLRKQIDVLSCLNPGHIHRRNSFLRSFFVALTLAMCQMKYILVITCRHVSLVFEPDIGPAVQCHTVCGECPLVISSCSGTLHIQT